MKRICNIYNYPSHYRLSVYKMMDQLYTCTFRFGDMKSTIKKMDIKELKDADYYHISEYGHFTFLHGILKLLFKKYDYYIFTVETNCLTHWLFFLFAKFYRKKTVLVWGHGMYGYENFGQMLVRKLYYGLTDGIIVYGNYAKKIMVNSGFSESKIFPIHNSLNYYEQLKIRKVLEKENKDVYKERFGNSNPVLIFIGRLTKIKKLNQILESARILKEKNESYNIMFIGDGEEMDTLKALAHKYDLDENTWFYGACYDEKTNASLIYNADLCVSPGNVGLTSIHCFTFGTPVATHNNFSKQMPEFEVIQQGVTGCYFEMDNVNSIANAISNWFKEHKKDREKVRKRCFEIIDKEWNPNYQINVLQNLIR